MCFDWSRLIDVAQHLVDGAVKKCDSEACYRSSTGRSYYAAFCMVKKYIKQFDGIEFTDGAHRKVREHLLQSHNKTKKMIANQLKDLHYERIKADYWDKIPGNSSTLSMAKKSITLSRKILSELDLLINQ